MCYIEMDILYYLYIDSNWNTMGIKEEDIVIHNIFFFFLLSEKRT